MCRRPRRLHQFLDGDAKLVPARFEGETDAYDKIDDTVSDAIQDEHYRIYRTEAEAAFGESRRVSQTGHTASPTSSASTERVEARRTVSA